MPPGVFEVNPMLMNLLADISARDMGMALVFVIAAALIVMVGIWLLRYMGAPAIVEKVVIVIAVLCLLLYLVQRFL